MTERTRQAKRWPWWAKLLVALTPILIAVIVASGFEIIGHRAYNRAMDEARTHGPVTIEEIEAARRIWPDEKNGGRIILDVAPRLPDLRGKGPHDSLPIVGEARNGPLGEKWSSQVLSDVDRYLADKSAELQMIDRLLQYQGGRFPFMPQPNPMKTQSPHLSGLRTSAKLKTLQVVRKSMADDVVSLVPDLQIILLHGKLLQDEPSLLSSLVHVALDAMAVDTLQQVLAQTSLKREQLLALGPLLAVHASEDRLAWGFLGERATMVAAGRWVREGGEGGRPRFGVRGWLLYEEAVAIELWSPLISTKPNSERSRIAAEMGARAAALPDRYSFTKIFVSSFERAVQLDTQAAGMLRSAIAGVAAEQFRMEKGRYPKRLEDLVPDYLKTIPLDPFDDKPLRYRVDADAVIIYSIGENGIDDGGDVNCRTAPGRSPTDWGFVLLKPEFRGQPPAATTPATRGAETASASSNPAR